MGNKAISSNRQNSSASRPQNSNNDPISQVQTPSAAAPNMSGTSPSSALNIPGPPPTFDINYIPGYLASNIGKNVRAEFIIGTTQYADKQGVLSAVGVNYFVLHDVNSRTDIMCDLYSVKFVTILRD